MLREARLVAGHQAQRCDIQSVCIAESISPVPPERCAQLLLTTGGDWPRDEAGARQVIRALAASGVAAVVLSTTPHLPSFPPSSIREAQASALPLLEISGDIAFYRLAHDVHAHLVHKRIDLMQRCDEINRTLTITALSANSLDDLAQALGLCLGRTVRFLSADGTAMGTYLTAGYAPAPAMHRGAYLQYLQDHRVIERMNAEMAPVIVERCDAGDAPRRLVSAMRIGGDIAGFAMIDENATPIGPTEIRAIEHASLIGALHLSHARALHLQEERLGYSMVAALLEGKFVETPAALERARMSGWDAQAPYRICLMLLGEPLPLSREGFSRREQWVERLRRYLDDIGQPPLIVVSLNQIRFLLSPGVAPASLWRQLGHRTSALAVSREHVGIDGMAKGGEDVQSLLPSLKPGKIHYFEQIMFPRALLGDANARALFIDSQLGPLLADKRQKPLLETLRALCEEGFQWAATARRLNVHISTVHYRVERIEAMLGVDFDTQSSRFEVQVAMAMLGLTEDS
ncbi:CdaR family transcriptional regulator [Pandoraea anhela]|uniref:CdaR family transcriptional regulator n=2 Tax=Pandoraea anhela TaxID=2508295 RepID=A0A5E4X978_9BURK|nr:CdaR family transcriptional regulator [Pandoraea anhela]